MAWLELFRIVNLPTVPGDVLVGIATMCGYCAVGGATVSPSIMAILAAVVASCCAYLYGLVDNDIVGAKTDGPERPIPRGDISLSSARVVRGVLWGAVLIVGAAGRLPCEWWVAMLLLFAAMITYNRKKWPFMMGLCRGLNVVAGAMVVGGIGAIIPPVAVAVIWTAYIWGVTKFSEGEDESPTKRATVGFLIGAIIYLQLGALVFFTLMSPSTTMKGLLLTGATMLILLRVLKSMLPKVSAS